MSIQHLLKGNNANRIGDARVDKMEADRLNSIVERISGVNPSKLASEVTGAPVQTSFTPAMRAQVGAPERGPGPKLGSQLPWGAEEASQEDPGVVRKLANKVAMLEQRLAKYEVFNGQDNDVVITSNRPSKGPSNRGPDSTVFARDIDPKKAKVKDPADGKPDAPSKKEAQMTGEHINILGISMNEWREMAGISKPPVDLTARPQTEDFEDVVEGDEQPEVSDEETDGLNADESADVIEGQLWSDYLRLFDSNPEEFAAFVEAADNAQDSEVLLAIQDLEDEFTEAVNCYLEGDAAEKETIDQFVKRGGVVKKLRAGSARGAAPLSKFLRAKGGRPALQGHELPASVKKEDHDLGLLWSQWLEARGLSVDTFDALVEAVETDDDLQTLEQLQAMFEAEIVGKRVAGSSPVPGGESELHQPGKAPVKTVSVARGEVKPARKNVPGLPKFMRRKMGMSVDDSKTEDMDAFECDCDEKGDPDMNHPGWAKAMKRFKKSHKKGKKS